jgi:large subunit ribosomal protein L6
MSRIGKLPIELPKGVTVTVEKGNYVTVKGPKGEIKQQINPDMTIEVNDTEVVLTRPSEQKRHKALHGLSRALLGNMVEGVSEGYKIEMEMVGVGYRAAVKGSVLEMSVGYSHDIHFQFPKEVQIEAKQEKRGNPMLTITSADKQLIGQVAAKIRSLRPPEPYKGKGIKFVGEHIRRKAGKSASV